MHVLTLTGLPIETADLIRACGVDPAELDPLVYRRVKAELRALVDDGAVSATAVGWRARWGMPLRITDDDRALLAQLVHAIQGRAK